MAGTGGRNDCPPRRVKRHSDFSAVYLLALLYIMLFNVKMIITEKVSYRTIN